MKMPRYIKVKKLWIEDCELKGTIVFAKWYLFYVSIMLIVKKHKFKLWQYLKPLKLMIRLICNTNNEQEIG